MSISKTNLPALDKLLPNEVVCELLGFAGGENTLGSDSELGLNESRRMENWEVFSQGGMERCYGFSCAASGVNYVGSATFDGSGLDDMTPSGVPVAGEYAQASGTREFVVEIVEDSTNPDQFAWSVDDLCKASGVSVTSSGYMLEDNIYVTWAATNGHTEGDKWTFNAYHYLNQPDFLIEHSASGSVEIYTVIEGDLLKKSEKDFILENESAFSNGAICHGVSIHDQLWITNAVDGLKTKVMDGPLSAPADSPSEIRDRIYYFKSRLIAEGGGKTIYGSRVQPGYWTAADAWSLVNDAWNITMPDETYGMAIGFPSGDDVTVFTERQAFALYGMPNIAHQPIPGSHGCSAPWSIAIGEEGVYLVSRFPSLGVFLWNGSEWKNLTIKQDFVNDINFSYRIFGIYRNRKYYLMYTSTTSGLGYPDTVKVFDALFGRWYTRKLNTALSETLGFPTVLLNSTGDLYISSSQKPRVYDFDSSSYTSDDGENTVATYETKNLTSADFHLAAGGAVPIDEVRIKLTKFLVVAHGEDGVITLNWIADRGRATGGQVVPFSAYGDKLNEDFTVNSSYLNAGSQDTTSVKSFPNKAVGRMFNFQINDTSTTARKSVKKIKIHGVLLEEA